MIESSCHCQKIILSIEAEIPESLTSCNCSLCSKYGGLLAYFPKSKVQTNFNEDDIIKYSRDEKNIEFILCKTCGCFSHWRPLNDQTIENMGFNARLFQDINLSQVKVRLFDGAETWKFLN